MQQSRIKILELLLTDLSFYRRSAGTVPEHEWTEEYDYVRLESRTAVGRRNAEIRAALPDKLRASFDALVRDADHAGEVRMVIALEKVACFEKVFGDIRLTILLHPNHDFVKIETSYFENFYSSD